VLEKYTGLARDAQSSGDRVLAESYYQYAEHYYRIVHESTDPDSPGSLRSSQHQQRNKEQAGEREGQLRNGDEEVAPAPASIPRSSRSPSSASKSEALPVRASSTKLPHVNGESDDHREGLERALGAVPSGLAVETEGEAKTGNQENPAKNNGQRSSSYSSYYRRSPRSESKDKESSPQRRQFPLPIDPPEQPEGGES